MPNIITDSSFKVLDVIAQGRELSQRELATQSGLSLGMVNLIISRLIRTGYIKVSSMNRKKIDYILTPKGLSERLTRSYHYFLRSYHAFRESQRRIDALLDVLIERGSRRFMIVGEGEMADIVEVAFRSRPRPALEVRRVAQEPIQNSPNEVVLDCRFHHNRGPIGISVLEEILRFSSYKEGFPKSVNGAIKNEK